MKTGNTNLTMTKNISGTFFWKLSMQNCYKKDSDFRILKSGAVSKKSTINSVPINFAKFRKYMNI